MASVPSQLRNRSSWVALAIVIVLQSTTPVWAWGRLGHRVTSRIAKRHRTEETRDAVAELLEPGETIADASTWADENRRRLPRPARLRRCPVG